jgi:PAS domain S-box-containing protein
MTSSPMQASKAKLDRRIFTLRWAIPLTLAAIAVIYQLGPARLVQDRFGHGVHYAVEIVFYATSGPLLAYWTLTRLGRWVEEKELAEQQARASEQRLASITAASADAILSLDADGLIASWNRGAELTFGYSAMDIVGRPLSYLLGGAGAAEVEYEWLVESVRREGFATGHETVCRDAVGRQVPVELTATKLSGAPSETWGMSVILRDITERKWREAEIRELNASLRDQVTERTQQLAEKIEALGRANADLEDFGRLRSEFVSLVSHQIRAPLTNMRGAIEQMQSRCGITDSPCLHLVTVLDQQVDRLDRLVVDVLNAARIESGELTMHPEPVSILPVAAQAVEQFRASRSSRPFVLPVKPGLPPVLADRDRVADILTNLLDNADKYSPPGESVVVEVYAELNEVTISVRDAGPGIPPGDLDRVFEKHYRVDGSDSQAAYGYGLGLYVCRRLVDAQGGRIWAENLPEGGARFSFTLPVAPDSSPHPVDRRRPGDLLGRPFALGRPTHASDRRGERRAWRRSSPAWSCWTSVPFGRPAGVNPGGSTFDHPVATRAGNRQTRFHLGVDDYVTKPFSFAELTARVHAVLARAQASVSSPIVMSGDLSFNFDRRRVTAGERIVELTPTEYRLLEVLARHAGRPVSSETLLDEVWGPTYAGDVEYVKHFIWALRKKIEADPGDPKHLLTERGFGYRLE